MAERWRVIPEDLLSHLKRKLPAFKALSAKHQMALARMAWTGNEKRRAHDYFEGYSSFSHHELEQEFGRGSFPKINAQVGFFEMTPNWSKSAHYTRGYRLSTAAKAAMGDYLSRTYKEPVALLYGDGATLKSLPKAVASKDMDGITTTAWRNAKELNKVPVDLEQLGALKKLLEQRLKDLESGCIQEDLFHSMEDPARIKMALETTAKIMRMARTDVAGIGYVSHRYVESGSGRLYAKGVNLQTVPKLIKCAALSGLWEYDFENCHYSILAQMAAKYGIECPNIRSYLDNKKETRQRIADVAGITIEQAKTCLIAIIYGARASVRHEDAIPEAIGPEAAKRLYSVPEFQSIHTDIKKARTGILKGCPLNKSGWLTNAFGKGIRRNASAEQRLAHLIQGVEAMALKACIETYPLDICLIQHDGFASMKRKLDTHVLERNIERSTGYAMTIEESLIQVDLSRHFGPVRSKTISS